MSRLLAVAAASLFFSFSPSLARSGLRTGLRSGLRSGLRWSGFLSGFIKLHVVVVFFGQLDEVGGFLISRITSMFLVDLVWM